MGPKEKERMQGKTILIVDDEESVRRLVRRVLGDDYIVLEVADGEEAVQITQKSKPDLVLMDIMMPRKDGYAALSEIKTNPDTKSTPVAMLSGIGFELNKKLADGFGVSGYITKPFDSKELLKTVGKFVKASD